ncbi:hypothetical protein HGB07_03130 [Candidatus Roizmanbacteria bacterium]|nr:hypothetical protein [Candidatus Roizmanbacteria bacterium]
MFLLMSLLAQTPTGTSWKDLTGTQTDNNCIVDGVPTLKCLEIVSGNLLFLSSAFIILVLFVMFIMGGYLYLTSFGSPEKVKKAQGTIRYALIGLILYVSSFLILKTIDFLFLGNNNMIFKFEIPSQ